MTAIRQAQRDAARLWRLAVVNGVPEPGRVRQIVEHVIASGRRGRLAVLASFLRRLKRDLDRRTAEVDSAVPLDAATRAAVEAGLARRYGHAMTTTFVVDPTLIAGIRLTAGGDLYDSSVRARLSALEMQR